MADYFSNARNFLGQQIENIGTAFNLPEGQISERIAGNWTPLTNVTPQSQAIYGGDPAPYRPNTTIQQTQQNAPVRQVAETSTQQTQNQQPSQIPQQTNINDDLQRRQDEARQREISQINNLFGESQNYLNNLENTTRSQYGDLQNQIGQQFDTTKKLLGEQKAGAESQIGEQELQTQTQRREADAASRRLYNELQTAGQQRFGGASSAGQAFSELSSVEQQRRAGAIARDYQVAQRGFQQARQQLTRDFNQSLLLAEQRKSDALTNAKVAMQNKLMEIERSRSELGERKNMMVLSAIQNYRNQVFQIQQAKQQFDYQLQLQYQSDIAGVAAATEKYAENALSAVSNFNTFSGQTTTSPKTKLTVAPGVSQPTNQLPTGVRRDDELIGALNREDLNNSLFA